MTTVWLFEPRSLGRANHQIPFCKRNDQTRAALPGTVAPEELFAWAHDEPLRLVSDA